MSVMHIVGLNKTLERVDRLVTDQGVNSFHIKFREVENDERNALLVKEEHFTPALDRLERMSMAQMVEDASNLALRGEAALTLLNMALKHRGGGAYTAAGLLLSMEFSDIRFSLVRLTSLDTSNRRLANILLMGIRGGDFLPSEWISNDTGEDGSQLMWELREAWTTEDFS
tara:strand:- start:151 stop:663 length:513 start_codon:yes stop_codon:yes gene_type:complete